MPELLKIDTQAQLLDEKGNDLEAERRLRVILMPFPFLHSADQVPEKMRYVVAAEPPLSAQEADRIASYVDHHEELRGVLSENTDERMGDIGFSADHLGMQKKHLERGAILAGIAIEVLGINAARIIFNELVPNEELELFVPSDFDDNSDYHLEPRHYVYVPKA